MLIKLLRLNKYILRFKCIKVTDLKLTLFKWYYITIVLRAIPSTQLFKKSKDFDMKII